MESEKITYIKKDAQIPVVIGTAFLSRLQSALIAITEEKTDDEIEAFKAALTAKVPLEGWMAHYETLALLIKEIEDSAASNGMIQIEDLT